MIYRFFGGKMLQYLRSAARNSRGMTLLEIMIVLAILGGIITILATQVTSRLASSRVKQARIHMAQIGNALDMFYTDCAFYPESLEALVTAPAECTNWGPEPYLKSMPKDPWGAPYIYENNGSSYVLRSLGADRREGGTGNDADISSEDL